MTTETTLSNKLPSQQSNGRGRIIVVIASLALHGVAYGALSGLKKPQRKSPRTEEPVYAPRKPKPPKRYTVKVTRPPRAKPPVASASTPRKLERLQRRPTTKRRPLRKTRAPRRAVKQVARTPRTLDLTQLPRAGVNATLTSGGGAQAYAVGSTAQGDPAAPAGKRPRLKGRQARTTFVPAAPPASASKPAPVTIKRLPQVLRVPRVAYPKRAKAKRIQGTVKLRVTVAATGRVLRVTVLKGLGHGLDGAAVRALKKARFKPALTSNGRAVAYTIRYRYRFRLQD